MAWETLKSAVAAVITANGNEDITGTLLKDLINDNIIEQLGAAKFKGLATPNTAPGTPEQEVFYITYIAGVYSNFDSLVVQKGSISLLSYRGSAWVQDVIYTDSEVFKSLKTISNGVRSLLFVLDNGAVSGTTGQGNTSINWLNSGLISVEENTEYTIGGYALTTLAANQRVTFVNSAGNVISVLPSGTNKTFTFTTPQSTTQLNVQIEAVVDSGADPANSPFNDTFYIIQGNEASYLKAETIQGIINTPQINSIEDFKNRLEAYVSYVYELQSASFTTGGLRDDGVTTSTSGYFRTSVTNLAVMYQYESGVFTYTGEIQDTGLAGVAYFDVNGDFISSEITEIGVYNQKALNIPDNTKYIGSCSFGANPVIEEAKPFINIQKYKSIFVDQSVVTTGDGTESTPFKTVTEAFNAVDRGGKNFIIINEGDYRETLPLANLGGTDLEIIGLETKRVRFLGSDKLENWTAVSGSTFKCAFSGTIPSWGRFNDPIFEDNNPSKPIDYNLRHPLQKGLSNRLPFTMIEAVADIATVNSTPGSYYYDTANDEIYIHTTNSDNPNTNGFSYEVNQRAYNTYNAHDEKQRTNITMHNLQFMFGTNGLVSEGFNKVERYNCVSLANSSAGAFRDDAGTFIVSYYDEAGSCDNDGVNGHFATYTGYNSLTDHRSMQPTAIYYEPWCHDNHDDGMSHHENHNVKVIGGLFEYNGDGGIRASNDANYMVNNLTSRYNGWDISNTAGAGGEGLAVVNPTLNPNRNGCKMIAFNCFLHNNNCGVSAISQADNVIELIDCTLRNNNKEIYVSSGKVISRNTKATNADPTKLKVVDGSGSIVVENDTLLT